MSQLPEFSLPDRQGGVRGIGELLQQQDMVLAVVHGEGCSGCGPLLDELGREAQSRDMTHAAALAVVEPGAPAPEGAPISVLEDRDGSVGRKLAESVGLGADESFVLVADRFGTPVAVKPIHGADPKGLAQDAFDTLDYIEMQCPECGAPEW